MAVAGIVSAAAVAVVVVFAVVLVFLREWQGVSVCVHVCICVCLIIAELDLAPFHCQILKQLMAVCDVQPPSQEKNGLLMVSV